jgi:predicted nucleic acid-binding protein
MSPGVSVERTEPLPAVVCDAGPLIHLDELGSLDLLLDFEQVLVPLAVWREVARHRPHVLEPDPDRLPHLRQVVVEREAPAALTALARSLVLGAGECEALLVALQQPGLILLTDDAAARLAAEALQIRVHGSIGVLVRAVRMERRTREQAIATLQSLGERSSLHVRPALIDEVLSTLRVLSPR